MRGDAPIPVLKIGTILVKYDTRQIRTDNCATDTGGTKTKG